MNNKKNMVVMTLIIVTSLLILGTAGATVNLVRQNTLRFEGTAAAIDSAEVLYSSYMKVGIEYYETDQGRTWVYDGSAWRLKRAAAASDTTAMFAAGYSAAASVAGFTSATWYFQITSIDSTITAAIQARKLPGGWADIERSSWSYSTTGTYGLTWSEVATADSMRFRWIGGTGELVHWAGFGGE